MACWLVKSDPEDYSFADLERDRRTKWDGVANALALKHLRAMRKGDACFVYETGKVRALVGLARVAAQRSGEGDARAVDVELAVERRLARPVSLAEIKADAAYGDFPLVRMGRLSVMPVPENLRRRLSRMAGE